MLAITLSFPPQRRQRLISIANTRFSRCIHVMLTCFAMGGAVGSALRRAPRPLPAGVIAPRRALAGAKMPWAHELTKSLLAAARNELLQRFGDSGFLRLCAADFRRSLDEFRPYSYKSTGSGCRPRPE
jgi:hypothetical protein